MRRILGSIFVASVVVISTNCHDFYVIQEPAPVCLPNTVGNLGVTVSASGPRKIFQVVGDLDRQFDPPTPTRFRTESTVGLVGTDLGFSFLAGDRLYFLFGDAIPHAPFDVTRRPINADVIGYADGIANGSDADAGDPQFDLKFVLDDDGLYRGVRLDGQFLLQDDVPNTGFSIDDRLVVFFAVDVLKNGGHSVIATSTDGAASFQKAIDVPSTRMTFVVPKIIDTAVISGLSSRWANPKTLLVWGRKGNQVPILAAAPLDGFLDASQWIFYLGDAPDGTAQWTSNDSAAAPVACTGLQENCDGGFSVTYIPGLDRWLMLDRCHAPYQLMMRVAQSPLGPWSPAQPFFNPTVAGATCKYMHRACSPDAGDCCDQDFQPEIPNVGFGPSVQSYPYGPYVIEPFTSWNPATHTATIYFLTSVFNPYSPMFMSADLIGADH